MMAVHCQIKDTPRWWHFRYVHLQLMLFSSEIYAPIFEFRWNVIRVLSHMQEFPTTLEILNRIDTTALQIRLNDCKRWSCTALTPPLPLSPPFLHFSPTVSIPFPTLLSTNLLAEPGWNKNVPNDGFIRVRCERRADRALSVAMCSNPLFPFMLRRLYSHMSTMRSPYWTV